MLASKITYNQLPPFGGRRLSPEGLMFGVNHVQSIFCLDTEGDNLMLWGIITEQP